MATTPVQIVWSGTGGTLYSVPSGSSLVLKHITFAGGDTTSEFDLIVGATSDINRIALNLVVPANGTVNFPTNMVLEGPIDLTGSRSVEKGGMSVDGYLDDNTGLPARHFGSYIFDNATSEVAFTATKTSVINDIHFASLGAEGEVVAIVLWRVPSGDSKSDTENRIFAGSIKGQQMSRLPMTLTMAAGDTIHAQVTAGTLSDVVMRLSGRESA